MCQKTDYLFCPISIAVSVIYIRDTDCTKPDTNSVFLNNGGEKQLNATHLIVGTVGQIGVDLITNTSHQVQPGFWNMYYQDVVVSVEDEDIYLLNIDWSRTILTPSTRQQLSNLLLKKKAVF